ncbi:MAG: intradiol ring-cleavage dioxygenase [Myxococcota bacterium]|nr:intradiol ring-cleavage dioxygenase [Myxococcota bacterium]
MDDHFAALGRRRFLLTAAAAAVLTHPTARALAQAETCGAPTEPNIEGPFFRPGAPLRDVLAGPGVDGERLALSGRVLDTSCRPIAGVRLEIWHADHRGDYDLDGNHLRGVLESDARGRWSLRSIVPGRYRNGAQYRPSHVHVKVAAPRKPLLTTQLYFQGDPFLAADPFVRRSLVLRLRDGEGGKVGAFDFVVA